MIKCLVWDLDDTVWSGTLLEGGGEALRPGVRELIETLDGRGVLHAIASKNEPEHALARLQALSLDGYFLHPQIGWGPKSESVQRIAQALNIGIDALAFIDDQPFERDEVRFHHPAVLCFDAAEVEALHAHPRLSPTVVSDEARMRRQLYRADIARAAAEAAAPQAQEAFLASLNMRLTIAPASALDLLRAEELVHRTHQLNTTGRTYDRETLEGLISSPEHLFLVARLDDVYGPYGTIGLALIAREASADRILLLLMSCRVMSRGVGSVLINHVRKLSRDAGRRLLADFVPTDKNRMMYMSYKFGGFRELSVADDDIVLEADPDAPIGFPDYIERVLL